MQLEAMWLRKPILLPVDVLSHWVAYYNLQEVDFGQYYTEINMKKEFMGRDIDHSRPISHGGTHYHKNTHYMCSYHNQLLKNSNPFFDVNTLHHMFFP